MSTGGKSSKRSKTLASKTGSSRSRDSKSGSFVTSRSTTGKSESTKRPFDAKTLTKARKIVSGYRLVIEPSDEVGFFGRMVEMPYVMADGATVEECVRSLMDAAVGTVATLIEQGDKLPSPASAAKRDQQVNIRLTADEKMRLDDAARHAGYRSLSDFVRNAALESA